MQKIFNENNFSNPAICLGYSHIGRQSIYDFNLPPSLLNCSIKRQMDFIAGRKAAELAIRKLNIDLDTNVGIDADGLPIWPDNIVGSISHSDKWAIAAVSYCESIEAIGIDIESKSSSEIISVMADMVLSPSEKTEKQCPTSLLLRFCAKESVYKCIYPIIRRFVEFHECTIEILAHNHFKASFNPSFLGKQEKNIKGIYEINEDMVITLSWINTQVDRSLS